MLCLLFIRLFLREIMLLGISVFCNTCYRSVSGLFLCILRKFLAFIFNVAFYHLSPNKFSLFFQIFLFIFALICKKSQKWEIISYIQGSRLTYPISGVTVGSFVRPPSAPNHLLAIPLLLIKVALHSFNKINK